MKLSTLAILLATCFVGSIWTLGTIQHYRVTGQLLCGDMPANKVKVKLIDDDTLGFDDVMGETFTSDDGTFYIDGKTEELTPIDPILKFYHDCYDDLPCQRRWKFAMPKHYIFTSEENPENKTVDVGVMNLEIVWHDDERSCLN